MPHELIYTSAPRGLRPGTTGYCTVAHTPGLDPNLAEQLQALSHFRHLHVGDDPNRNGNPIAFAHSILTLGYRVYHVVSRVADSGLDHSGRSNFLAHHVVFDTDSIPDVGPAWLCEQRFFVQKWDRQPSQIPDDRAIPSGRDEARVCRTWAKLAGDAGWGGVLAAATNAAEPAYIIYEPGQDVIGLVSESMALLPLESRWNVTFNTYFTGGAVRTTCQWRCVPVDSAEAKEALTQRRGLIIRIDQPMRGEPSGPLVEAARKGFAAEETPIRRAVPSATVRSTRTSSRPAAIDLPDPEPDFEPESLPMPAPRIRRREQEPEPEVEESSEMTVYSNPPKAAGKSSLGPLILGLLLGGLLAFAFTTLVELAAGKSILGFLGVKSKDEEDAKKEVTRLEGELSSKSAEVTRATERSGTLSSDLRSTRDQLSARAKELNELTERYDKLNQEHESLKNKPVSGQIGFFASIREQVKEHHRNQELATTRAEIEKLKTEIMGLQTRLMNAGNVAVAPSLPVQRLDKINLGGQPNYDLFRVKLSDNAKPRLELFGLPPDMEMTPLGDGNRIRITSKETGFDGTLEVGKDGQVRIVDGKNMDRHPVLGAAVIKVTSGEESPPAYRQLFWPTYAPSSGLTAEMPKGSPTEGPKRRYVFDYSTRLGALLRPEVESLKNTTQLAGRHARIGVDKKIYDLEPGADAAAIENRAGKDDPALKLTVEGGRVVIDVTFPAGVLAPDRCDIAALEIVRIIKEDKERNFPGYSQELLRLYPK